MFPLMLGLSAMARPLFLALFTAKWLPSVPFFQVLCFSGAIYHLQALNLDVLKASGRSGLYLKITVIKITLALAGALIAFHFGMMGVVIGQVLIAGCCLLINSFYTGQIIAYSLRAQAGDLWPYALFSLIAACLVRFTGGYLGSLPYWTQVVLLVLCQGICYLGLARVFRVNGPVELWGYLHTDLRNAVPQSAGLDHPVSGGGDYKMISCAKNPVSAVTSGATLRSSTLLVTGNDEARNNPGPKNCSSKKSKVPAA